MSVLAHKIYIGFLSVIVLLTLIALTRYGMQYYNTTLEERFYHPDHDLLKPSGALGHGLGILGSLFMIIGVSTYMARKRFRWMLRLGKLEHWLEFHIFLCTLGPIMVLFHTAFKFGGIVAIIGCYKGMSCGEGAEGVGRATTEAVVYSSITILISNFFLTMTLGKLLGTH